MPPAATTSRIAQFITRRIYELSSRRSQSEIATAAGLASANFLSMIKDGKAKLPMDRVIGMSDALEVDPAELARLALEQFFEGPTLELILTLNDTKGLRLDPVDINATAVALRIEVEMARHDLKFCGQVLKSASSRVDRAKEKITRVNRELDVLITISGAAV